ncbi:MAG: cation:proton antiporter domain-containing protein, partial [Solirubrobacteraceae bacterium]
CYGLAVADPHGNAFIAVFVCAIALGTHRPDIRGCFEDRSEDLIEVVKLGIFVVFGSLLSFPRLFNDGWAAIALVALTLVVIRPLSIFISLHCTGLSIREKAFMGWFGPKGVATMTFSVLILHRDLAIGERMFDIAALAVLSSIIAHGITDAAGADWIARQAEPDQLPTWR